MTNNEKMPISEIHNCDCMDFMRTIPDKFFDLAVVDPPYGIDKAFTPCSRITRYGQTKTANDYKPTRDYFNELFRVSKNQIIWGYNHLSDMLPKCKEFIFWYKHQPVISYADGELAWTSFHKSAKCFDYPYFGGHNSDKIRIHPMQKPVALYAWIFRNYVSDGGGGRYSTRILAAAAAGLRHTRWAWTSGAVKSIGSISRHRTSDSDGNASASKRSETGK